MPEQPTHLWRDDGLRFTRGENGRYAMDDSEMAHPYQYTFQRLMDTGAFSTKPPRKPKLKKRGCTCADWGIMDHVSDCPAFRE